MISTKTCYFLLLSLLFVSLRAHDDHINCIHDQIEQNPEPVDIEEDFSLVNGDGRVLASSSQFRIYPYYAFLDSTSTSSYASYVKNKLVAPAVAYFQAALKIKYPVVGNLVLSTSVKSICGRTTPSILHSGVAADVFISYESDSESGTQIAATSQCYVASGSGRTLVSKTVINRNMLPVTTEVLAHERNMYTIMHEMMHTFGFSSALYPKFVDANGKTRTGHIKKVSIGGSTRSVIDVPPLTDMLRTFYGCSTVPGLVLENGGGSDTTSSHVERKFFLYDAMSSGSINGRRFSQFSLGLLEGTGWFVVDYDYAEPFFFGKGQGCSFVTGKCSSSSSQFDEFCNGGNSRGCSPTGRGGGSCQSDSLTESCKYYFPTQNNDCENDDGEDYARFPSLETYGRAAGSRCFTGNLNSRNSNSPTSFCFKYSCSGSGSSTQLTINVGNNKVVCTKAGAKTIDGYYGGVDCPNPQEFCETIGKQFCPRNCMGRGSCVSNKCVCRSGYSGIDCALVA